MTLLPDQLDYIRNLARRVCTGNKPADIGVDVVAWVKAAARNTDTFADAYAIKQAFPEYFLDGV